MGASDFPTTGFDADNYHYAAIGRQRRLRSALSGRLGLRCETVLMPECGHSTRDAMGGGEHIGRELPFRILQITSFCRGLSSVSFA